MRCQNSSFPQHSAGLGSTPPLSAPLTCGPAQQYPPPPGRLPLTCETYLGSMSDSSRARRQRGVVAVDGGETADGGTTAPPASAARPLRSPRHGVWDLRQTDTDRSDKQTAQTTDMTGPQTRGLIPADRQNRQVSQTDIQQTDPLSKHGA